MNERNDVKDTRNRRKREREKETGQNKSQQTRSKQIANTKATGEWIKHTKNGIRLK